jgi:acyl carrier protein
LSLTAEWTVKPTEKGAGSDMKGSMDDGLKTRIKTIIVDNCDLEVEISDIDDDAPLFESSSKLALDSIDALQISIAIQNTFGIAIRDSKQMRRVMKSINSFADYIQPA